MIILAVDTTSYGCSVAVVEGDTALSERHLQKRETHSKHLLPIIDQCLVEAGVDIHGVGGYAVATGPGSFTGLRIGISTLKGLAVANDKQLVGVSSLLALASGVPNCGARICPVIDARKNEIYASFFEYNDSYLTRVTEDFAMSPEMLVREIDRDTVFVGSGVDVYKKLFLEQSDGKALFLDGTYNFINAVNIAKLAALDLKSCKNNVQTLVPNYIRKSDAEINLENNRSR